MAFDLRPPRPADLGRLQAIEDAADARFLALFRPDTWWPASPGEERAASPGFILVAAEGADTEAVGFVHVVEVDGLAHLEQLAVIPEYGRRGLGRALVTVALNEARARGHDRMTLRTYADVPWNAAFYASCGFVESQPDEPYLLGLVKVEEQLGLSGYGRRVQMTAQLGQLGPATATDR